MRILFFGTPEFAVPSLRALAEAGHEVAAVVTQPDRSTGRSRSVVVPPPVKVAAEGLGIPVLQPDKPVGTQFIDQLSCASRRILAWSSPTGTSSGRKSSPFPRLGMINVHASLLPRWRGAAPIQWAIRAGDRTTGITIMQMEAGLDSGPVWHARSIPIGPGDTGGSLTERLSVLGAAGAARGHPAAHQRRPTDGTGCVRGDPTRPRSIATPRASTGVAAPGSWHITLRHSILCREHGPRLASADVKLFARRDGTEEPEPTCLEPCVAPTARCRSPPRMACSPFAKCSRPGRGARPSPSGSADAASRKGRNSRDPAPRSRRDRCTGARAARIPRSGPAPRHPGQPRRHSPPGSHRQWPHAVEPCPGAARCALRTRVRRSS